MRIIVAVIAAFIFTSCSKDKGPTYSNYSAVPTASKSPLVTENFIDNHNGWNFIDTTFLFNPLTHPGTVCQILSPGRLTLWANGGIGDQYFTYNNLDKLENFELEREVKLLQLKSGMPDQGTRLYLDWGFVNINEHVNFIKIDGKGYVDFGDSQGPTRRGVKPGGLSIWDYNRLTIRKVGRELYYFVNEGYVGRSELQQIAGSNIGFRTMNNTVFEMRNFRFMRF